MLIGPATDSDIAGVVMCNLASAIDLANAWARQSHVQECTEVCGLALRDLIERLWAHHLTMEKQIGEWLAGTVAVPRASSRVAVTPLEALPVKQVDGQ